MCSAVQSLVTPSKRNLTAVKSYDEFCDQMEVSESACLHSTGHFVGGHNRLFSYNSQLQYADGGVLFLHSIQAKLKMLLESTANLLWNVLKVGPQFEWLAISLTSLLEMQQMQFYLKLDFMLVTLCLATRNFHTFSSMNSV